MFVFLLAFFILCGGVVVAHVARARGRSAWAWGLLTCVVTAVAYFLAQVAAVALTDDEASLTTTLLIMLCVFVLPVVVGAVAARLPPAIGNVEAPELRMYRLGDRQRAGRECVVRFDPAPLVIEAEDTLRVGWPQVEDVRAQGECVVLTVNPRGTRELLELQPLGGVDLAEARIRASELIAKRIERGRNRST